MSRINWRVAIPALVIGTFMGAYLAFRRQQQPQVQEPAPRLVSTRIPHIPPPLVQGPTSATPIPPAAPAASSAEPSTASADEAFGSDLVVGVNLITGFRVVYQMHEEGDYSLMSFIDAASGNFSPIRRSRLFGPIHPLLKLEPCDAEILGLPLSKKPERCQVVSGNGPGLSLSDHPSLPHKAVLLRDGELVVVADRIPKWGYLNHPIFFPSPPLPFYAAISGDQGLITVGPLNTKWNCKGGPGIPLLDDAIQMNIIIPDFPICNEPKNIELVFEMRPSGCRVFVTGNDGKVYWVAKLPPDHYLHLENAPKTQPMPM